MPLDAGRARKLLAAFAFKPLFIEELGWNHFEARLEVVADGQSFRLSGTAEKCGMVAFVCGAGLDGQIPGYPMRRKIERQVAKSAHEHLVIFVDAKQSAQIWQWVRREQGKPAACREHPYHCGQPGDSLIQKLTFLAIALEEEESLTLPDVTGRARKAFDVERVTKRFYDRFKAEHATFLDFLEGIPDKEMERWYVSVMLNRLMFIYFIQKKGFLNSDHDYLKNKLAECRKELGKNRYYREFLCPLFFEGFAKRKEERSVKSRKLLGEVPYLNGGIFMPHQIEQLHGKTIVISDVAFEKLFEFFDAYQWHLDERPLRKDDEINPDVLGYIFEKYINQKQMGAYYTKEDITEYISKNTVIPFLFDAARAKCEIAFQNPKGPTVWDLLRDDPDRYIYSTVRHGVDKPLPSDIAEGIDTTKPNLIPRRKAWNKPAEPEYALPTETWREVVARRMRYEQVRGKLAMGEIRDINDLITFNLDIRQFAQDAIGDCEGSDLLRAFWHAIDKVTVLDPTCGSGAFLFAALNILEPLYEGCLDRMEAFVEDLNRSGEKHCPEKFSDFRKVLERVQTHPNRRSFIFKSIILNNLFGVDIMEEAVEICKLRLFLKLAAQVGPDTTRDNFGIEPLPDIDFNIRAGNTLVGFASYDDAKETVTSKLDFDDVMEKISVKAADLQNAFNIFRQQQTEGDGSVPTEQKHELRKHLMILQNELNSYLAGEYGVRVTKKDAYAKWLKSHEPFHWFMEFYDIMSGGGFDVIIGNPPYVEISDIGGQYGIRNLQLVETGNLYSVCIERFNQLLHNKGRVGVIVPISSVSTPRMLPLMKLLEREFAPIHFSSFAVRPSKLFVGVDMNLTIMLGKKTSAECGSSIFSTSYNRWGEQARRTIFGNLTYNASVLVERNSTVAKTGNALATNILKRLEIHDSLALFRASTPGSDLVFYHSGGRYFRKCIREQLSNEYKELSVKQGLSDAVICLLSSSFYYWFWIVISDCYHVTHRDIDALPVPEALTSDLSVHRLAQDLLNDLWKHAEKRIRNRADGSQREEVNFRVGESKSILDKIDRVLAQYYGFTEEELDFIINYDIKYRMGREVAAEDEVDDNLDLDSSYDLGNRRGQAAEAAEDQE
jgi:hypothetical protein